MGTNASLVRGHGKCNTAFEEDGYYVMKRENFFF